MAEPSTADDAVGAASAAIVGRLNDRLGEVTHAIQQFLISEIAELRADAQLLKLMRDSVEGNVDTVFSAIQHGISIERVEAPTAALEYARRLAQRGVSVNALVRAYRLGQQLLLNAVLDEVRLVNLDPRLGLAVFEQITITTFAYLDWISQLVVVAYQDERDRWLANRSTTRALRIRELLDTADVDVVADADADAMTSAIGYPLMRLHLALIVWSPETYIGEELTRMERYVGELAESIGARDTALFIAADRVTGWGWIPLTAEAAAHAVARSRTFAEAHPEGPSIALGDPLPGVDGFRRSHQQARAASAVCIAVGPQTRRIVAHADPGLSAAALLINDVDTARVWVGEVLGPLASPTEADERLRETLRIFLQARSSYKAAAAELNLHFNSVKYRVKRAEERRGRPIADDRLDVEIALLLCHWFDSAVLNRPASRP